MGAVVGFEIEITRIEAAAKLTQNQKAMDYRTIVEKLSASGDQTSTEVAQELVRRAGTFFPEDTERLP